jgi:hypothetical protein
VLNNHLTLRRVEKLIKNPQFRKMLNEKFLREKAEKQIAQAKKYAQSSPLFTYRIRIGIYPPPGCYPSSVEEIFEAYGNTHAREIVKEKMSDLKRNFWRYELISFVQVVVKEKTVSLLR